MYFICLSKLQAMCDGLVCAWRVEYVPKDNPFYDMKDNVVFLFR